MKILIIESFYTGSHRQWLDGIVKHIDMEVTTLTLPGKLWKWRTESSAYRLAEKYLALNMRFDRILFSGFFNLALFKSFVLKKRESIAPCYMYLHENQISYPWSGTDPDPALRRDQHYGFIDLMNCLLAEKMFFNSSFHRESFMHALPDFCNQFPEDYFLKDLDAINAKSEVLPIGLELQKLQIKNKIKNAVPVLLWNHRWEYDKNPELFFESLFLLKESGVKFQLIVLGEKYKKYPKIFDEAKAKLEKEIVHFAYAKDSETYIALLQKADILPVTSKHDFFGISVVEAIAASCVPLLPNDLAYPEHIPSEEYPALFYKSEDDFLTCLRELLMNYSEYSNLSKHVMKYDWVEMREKYEKALNS